MTMLLGPSKAVLSGTLGKDDGDGASSEESAPTATANGSGDDASAGESAESESAA